MYYVRFLQVLCADLSTSYVQTLARLMCRFMRVSRYARLARFAGFASVQRPYVYINTNAIVAPPIPPRPAVWVETAIYSLNSLSVKVPYIFSMLVSLSHGAQIGRSSSWTRAHGPELVDPSSWTRAL